MIYLMWVFVLLALFAVFQELDGRRSRSVQRVFLGADGSAELVLERNQHGHYLAEGSINGQPAHFLLDTGASDVSLPEGVAGRLGLRRGAPLRSRTANGTITVYATRLSEVRLGPLVLRDVKASINPHMEDEDVLLGMSFLRHLEFEQKQGALTLRQSSAN